MFSYVNVSLEIGQVIPLYLGLSHRGRALRPEGALLLVHGHPRQQPARLRVQDVFASAGWGRRDAGGGAGQ